MNLFCLRNVYILSGILPPIHRTYIHTYESTDESKQILLLYYRCDASFTIYTHTYDTEALLYRNDRLESFFIYHFLLHLLFPANRWRIRYIRVTYTIFVENIEVKETRTMKNENVKGINRGKSVSLMFIQSRGRKFVRYPHILLMYSVEMLNNPT